MKPWSQSDSDPEQARQRLGALREKLLQLHKAIIDSERETYEATFGVVASNSDFLQLLTQNPWFAWFRPISELIVVIDQALESDEPLTSVTTADLTRQIHAMIQPSEEGSGFGRHYFEALQRDPNVVLTHGELRTLLRGHGNERRG